MNILNQLRKTGPWLAGLVGSAWLPCAAQAPAPHNRRLDSLEAQLPQQPQPDTNRVNTLNELVWENRDSHPRRAMQLATEALALGEKLDFRRGQAKTYILRGIIFATTGRFEQSIADFEACRQQRAALGDWQGVAGAINNIGEVQASLGRYQAAVASYVKALRLEQRYGTPERIAADLANLGAVYFQMGQYRQALRYQQQYLRLPGRTPDAHNDAQTYQAVGESFEKMAQPDSALTYFEQAAAISHAHANPRSEGLARLGIGRLLVQRGQYAAAATTLAAAQALARQVDDQPALAAVLNAQGSLALRQQLPAARAYFAQAYALSRRLKARETTREALAGLLAAATRQADYRAAATFGAQLAALKDSLLTEASTRQIAELHIQYATEQKEAANRVQAAQLRVQQQVIRRRTVQLWAGLAVVGLLAGVGYLLYVRFRLRQQVAFAHERQLLAQQRAAAVLEAEEKERRRIGADLHDGVGQLLTATRLSLGALGQELPAATQSARPLLEEALRTLDESFQEVRGISHNLMPNVLLKYGLVAAVREFLGKMASAAGLRIEIEVFGLTERLPDLVEGVLFRVIQELAQNIIKHAQAQAITLSIVRGAGELTVMVEDNGVGFDPAALGPSVGIGLQNIRTRLAYLGGTADFDSSPGYGTTVTLSVPLAGGKAGNQAGVLVD